MKLKYLHLIEAIKNNDKEATSLFLKSNLPVLKSHAERFAAKEFRGLGNMLDTESCAISVLQKFFDTKFVQKLSLNESEINPLLTTIINRTVLDEAKRIFGRTGGGFRSQPVSISRKRGPKNEINWRLILIDRHRNDALDLHNTLEALADDLRGVLLIAEDAINAADLNSNKKDLLRLFYLDGDDRKTAAQKLNFSINSLDRYFSVSRQAVLEAMKLAGAPKEDINIVKQLFDKDSRMAGIRKKIAGIEERMSDIESSHTITR